MPTGIEYVDETYNPVTGCTKISAGCENCYAERMARRLAGRYGYPEAPHHFDVTLHPDRLDEPLRRKKPTRYLVCSMGDLFHKDVEVTFLLEVFNMMQTCNNHTFLVLTKRPKAMAEFMAWWLYAYRIGEKDGSSIEQVLANVWLGVTVETQDEMWRVEELLKIPGARHWVSAEPCLSTLDFTPWLDQLNWLVLGGETGSGARPMHPDWTRQVKDDCVAADVPFYFKQWGGWVPVGQESKGTSTQSDRGFISMSGVKKGVQVSYLDTCGDFRNTNELDSFEIPNGWIKIARVGKKAAGRLLDGQQWNEMPDG